MQIKKEIIDLFNECNRIVFFTGAGISVNCGIPDFRSENGLYSIVNKRYRLPYPEAIFEISYFRQNPAPFFEISKELLIKDFQPSFSHRFIAKLEEMNKVELVVTQNIDMLHTKAGSKKVIECHGSYRTAHCLKCNKLYQFDEIKYTIMDDKVPFCECKGVIKPDVVFFGEKLPDEFYRLMINPPECDLFVAIGSSLNVMPAAQFAIDMVRKTKNSILINKTETFYDKYFRFVLNEDSDIVFGEINNFLRLI